MIESVDQIIGELDHGLRAGHSPIIWLLPGIVQGWQVGCEGRPSPKGWPSLSFWRGSGAVSGTVATQERVGAYDWAMDTNPEVEAWFADYEHPLKDAMLRVRAIILSDDRMTETIKWKSPTFMYEGNMASFNPHTKAHISLMFHTGASIPGDHPRLIGGGETARYMKFESADDVAAAEPELRAIMDAWCTSRE